MPVLNVKPQYINGGDHQPPLRRKVELNDHYQTWLQNYNEIRHEVNSATAFALPRTIVFRNGNGDIGANRIFVNDMILGLSDPYGDPNSANSPFKLNATTFSLGPAVTFTSGGPAFFKGQASFSKEVFIDGALTVAGSSNFNDAASFNSLVSLSSSSTLINDGTSIFNEQVTINDDLELNGTFYFTGDGYQTGNSIIDGNLDLSEDLIVRGNLTVLGEKTQLEVSELVVEDKNIIINKNDLYTPLDSGIFIQKGLDERSGYFKVHAADDSLLQFKAPSSHIITVDAPNKDVTFTLLDDFISDQALLTTSNVAFRSITVDTSYSRHANVPSVTQYNDPSANTFGWVSTPWVYTNAIESFSNLTSQNTTGIFMGTSYYTYPNEFSVVVQGEERIYINDQGNIGFGTFAPSSHLHLYQKEPVFQISTDNYNKKGELRFTDFSEDITDSGLYLSYDANTSVGTLELTTNSPNSILNISVGGYQKTPEISLEDNLVTVNTNLDVHGDGYVANEFIVDSTLYVRTNKVGINVNNPDEALNVSGNIQGDSNLLLDGIEPFVLIGDVTTLESIGRSGVVVEEDSPIVQLSTTAPSYRHGSIVYFNDANRDRHWSVGTVNNGAAIDFGKAFFSGKNTPEYGLDEYHGETLLRLNSADRAEWYLESNSILPAMKLNTRTNGIHLYLGEQNDVQSSERSTTGYGPNSFSSVVQWHGSSSTTGELSYFPNGNDDGEYGSFRFSRTNGIVNTSHPSAKVGVEQLYAHDKIAVSQLTPTAELHITKDVTRMLQETESGQQYFSVDVDTSNIVLHGENVPGFSSFTLSALNPSVFNIRSKDYEVTTTADHSLEYTKFDMSSNGAGYVVLNDNLNDISYVKADRGDKLYDLRLNGSVDQTTEFIENNANSTQHLTITSTTYELDKNLIDQNINQHIDNAAEFIHERYTNKTHSSQSLELNATNVQFKQNLSPSTLKEVSLNPLNVKENLVYKPNYYSNTIIDDNQAKLENRADTHFFLAHTHKTNQVSRLELENVNEHYFVNLNSVSADAIQELATSNRTLISNLDDTNQIGKIRLDAPNGYHYHMDLDEGTTQSSFQEFTTNEKLYRVKLDNPNDISTIHLYNDSSDISNNSYELNIDDTNGYANQIINTRGRLHQVYIDDTNSKSWLELDNANGYKFETILDDPIDRGYLNLSTDLRSYTTELDGVANRSYIDMNNSGNYTYHVDLDGATTNASMFLNGNGKTFEVEVNHATDSSHLNLDHAADYYYHLNLDKATQRTTIDATTTNRYYKVFMDEPTTRSFLELNNHNNYYFNVDLDQTDSTSYQRLSTDVREFDVQLSGNLNRSYLKLNDGNNYSYQMTVDTAGTKSESVTKADTTELTSGSHQDGNTHHGFNNYRYTLKHIDPTDQCIYQAHRDHLTICVDTFFEAEATFNDSVLFNSEVVYSPTSNTTFNGPLTLNDEVTFSSSSNTSFNGPATFNDEVVYSSTSNTTFEEGSSTTINGDVVYGPSSNTTIYGNTTYAEGSTTTINGDTVYGPNSNTTFSGNTTVLTPMYFPPGTKSDLTFNLLDVELSSNWEYPGGSTPNTKYIVWTSSENSVSYDTYIYFGSSSGMQGWGDVVSTDNTIVNEKLFINTKHVDFSLGSTQRMLIGDNIFTNIPITQTHAGDFLQYEGSNKWLLKERETTDGMYWNKSGGSYSFSSNLNEYTNAEDAANQFVFVKGGTAKASIDIDTGSIRAGGDVVADNDIIGFVTSDRRYKDNIRNIDGALDKIDKIRGVEFDWKENPSGYNGHDIGVIAQEVQEVIPEAVRVGGNEQLQVNYEKLVPLLIQAIKEQDKKINYLEEEIKQLRK